MKNKIKIVENGIVVDINKLKEIINEWQSGELQEWYRKQDTDEEQVHKSVMGEVADAADALSYAIEKRAQKDLNSPHADLDWDDEYPKSDIRSIEFEVLRLLDSSWVTSLDELSEKDIPFILEFLDTPPDKTLEAWERWEKYWECVDYIAQQRKRLENNKL